MILEARPNQPQNSEGISPQQHERFSQLQTGILERLEPRHSTIIVTSDSEAPSGGYHLSVGKEGIWSVGYGRMGGDNLNEHDKPVELVEILKQYAFIQRYGELKQIPSGPQFSRRYYDGIIKLRQSVKESVEDNPGPFAESFLGHMENALEQLPREEK